MRPNKILLLEDDFAIRDSLIIVFEASDYELDLHANGDDLLKGDFSVPDLFILDKQLPGVDGLDICRYLKSRVNTKCIPVLIISASPHIDRLAMEAGADGFLEKPFKRKDFLETVERLINKSN